jgi:cytochrome c oxidase subunit 2
LWEIVDATFAAAAPGHTWQQLERKDRTITRTRVSRLWRYAPLTVLMLLLSGCIKDAPLDSLNPAGPVAEKIDGLWWMVFWIAAAVFVLVQGGILVIAFMFRDRPGRREPKQIHGNNKLEVLWTAIPALILAGIAVPTVQTIFELTDRPANALTIEVIGHQWWFEYVYPDQNITTANTLVIPAGVPVELQLTSEDVLHNFWVPQLAGKRYLVTGQETFLNLEADEPGEYWGQCAEFCGLSHALMRARVVALDEAGFEQWVAGQQQPAVEPPANSLAQQGRETFLSAGCTRCHIIEGVWEEVARQPPAPNLTHLASRTMFAGASFEFNEANLRTWLANPAAMKDGTFMPNLSLNDDEITALVAYLETLK